MASPRRRHCASQYMLKTARFQDEREDLQEPSIPASHSHIQHEVEILIERRARSSAGSPRIREERVVDDGVLEVAAVPHGGGRVLGLEADVEDVLQMRVHVGVQVVAGPFEAERVVALAEVGAADCAAGGCAPEGVEG